MSNVAQIEKRLRDAARAELSSATANAFQAIQDLFDETSSGGRWVMTPRDSATFARVLVEMKNAVVEAKVELLYQEKLAALIAAAEAE